MDASDQLLAISLSPSAIVHGEWSAKVCLFEYCGSNFGLYNELLTCLSPTVASQLHNSVQK